VTQENAPIRSFTVPGAEDVKGMPMKELAAVLLLTLASMAADVSGKWTGTFSVPGSDHKEPQIFTLKQDGRKLTGSGGPDAVEQYPITKGTVDDDAVKFELTTDKWSFKYNLKRVGQELNGDLLLKSKDGDTRTAHVALKKVVVAAEIGALQPEPKDAVPAILHAFDQFPIVAIGERHSLREVGDFYMSLVKDSGFQAKVNCIVIEFGTRLLQPILDRYISGEEVALAELQHVWRDTTKVFAFESPIYAELLREVREVNLGLPPARRIRVLAGDSPIDWTSVTTHEQWEAYQPNDLSFAEVINEQVLARNRKALVILGGSHVSKSRDPDQDPNTTTLVERRHPGTVYVVLLAASSQGQASKWNVPSLMPTPKPRDHGDFGDALLYLGDNLTPADPDWQHYRADPIYMKELDRRARIEWGCGFDLNRFIKGQLPCP
jgi:hypothetical protein